MLNDARVSMVSKPFVSIVYSAAELKDYLGVSMTEAAILQMLLQASQVFNTEFPTNSYRNHIQNMRGRFMRIFGKKLILSSAIGMYRIPDEHKVLIHKYIKEHRL
jgi:hypothetical protein